MFAAAEMNASPTFGMKSKGGFVRALKRRAMDVKALSPFSSVPQACVGDGVGFQCTSVLLQLRSEYQFHSLRLF